MITLGDAVMSRWCGDRSDHRSGHEITINRNTGLEQSNLGECLIKFKLPPLLRSPSPTADAQFVGGELAEDVALSNVQSKIKTKATETQTQ